MSPFLTLSLFSCLMEAQMSKYKTICKKKNKENGEIDLTDHEITGSNDLLNI